MKSRFVVPIAAALVLPLANMASAALTVSLTASADTTNLTVGETFTLTVVLSGLNAPDQDPNEELEFLTATVLVSDVHFSTPTVPTPVFEATGIVPVAGAANFQAGSDVDNANAFYDTFFTTILPPDFLAGPNITANGAFFTFELTATAPGSGEFTFSVAEAIVASDPLVVLMDSVPLAFAIRPNGAVPEPSSLALYSLALGFAGYYHRRNLLRGKFSAH